MRPVYTLPGIGSLREITIWKAIVFSILTFGIYFLVVLYQNTKDIQLARAEPFDPWVVFFVLGLFFPPLFLALYVFNMVGLSEIRDRTGLPNSELGLIALVLAVVVAPVGHIIWAVHFNETLYQASGG